MLQGTDRGPTVGEPQVRESSHPLTRCIYRFEDIEIDSSHGYVKRGGKEEYVRQQSFHVLLYLLEHREKLVSKEELIGAFWQDTAVTDNALVQCIADVRRVLNDDSRHPRFIKTVPKVGYRFIGNVTVERAQVPPIAPTSPKTARVDSAGAPPARAKRRWIHRSILFSLVAAILLFGAIVLFRSSAKRLDVTLPPLPGKKPVAVMYFENESHKAELNWLREGLADMFIADLAHSDKLTLLSRQQLQLLLERVGYQPDSEIRLDEALDVARRSHAEAVVLGSFAALGEGLLISVQLFDAATGRLLAADRFTVDRPAHILEQVDLLSLRLTASLGVTTSEGTKKATLADAMTKDLEAYRYYSLGVGKAQSFENTEAIGFLQKAIQRDPDFAMAYARIGYAYSVTDFLPDKGKPYLEKAFALSDRLTEKDRLYVTAWYAITRADYPAAIRIFRQIIATYPGEIEAYARLARLLLREERPQEAISSVEEGLVQDPDAGDLYNVLGMCFLAVRRYDDAIAAHQHYVQLCPKEPNAHDSLGISYEQSGKYAEANAEYRTALRLQPKFEPAIIHLGDVSAQQGRYRDAIREYRHYTQVTQSNEARAVAYGNIAQVYLRSGDLRLGEEAAKSETRFEPGAVWNSLLFALDRGDSLKVANLQERLFENSPYPERGVRNELRSYDYYLGTLALKKNRSGEAVTHFKEALGHLPPSSGMDLYEDCLANAYLNLGRLDEAISEYQRILHLNPNYPLAEYHLALAWERKGELAEAHQAYTSFLKIWKDADDDIPEVVSAKRKGDQSGALHASAF